MLTRFVAVFKKNVLLVRHFVVAYTHRKGATVKNNLKEIRDASGKKQETVAADLGISLSTYRSWEQGSRRLNGESLVLLASYFNVSSDSIIGTMFADKKFQHKTAQNAQHERLLCIFDLLNDEGQAKVFDYIDDLIQSGKYQKKEVQDYSVSGFEEAAIA